MVQIFLKEMEEMKVHYHFTLIHRYEEWTELAMGNTTVAKKMLAEGLPADVYRYIRNLIPKKERTHV